MSTYKDWIIRNNRITAPVIGLLLSLLVVMGAVYIYGELMFLVPVVIFFSFHYTKLYKLLLRFLGGTIVVIIVAFIATGFLTHAVYTSNLTYDAIFSDGSHVYASVTPYSGSASQYTYSLYVVPNGTFNYSSLDLNIHGENGYSVTVPYSNLTVEQTYAGNNSEKLTYVFSGISAEGVYSYNLTAQKNGTIYTPEISGPLNTSEFVVYKDLIPSYVVYYIIIYELIYVVGLFVARSIGNSRKYRGPPVKPPEQGPNQ